MQNNKNYSLWRSYTTYIKLSGLFFFFIILIYFLFSRSVCDYKIYALVNEEFVGDTDQVRGATQDIIKYFKSKGCSVSNFEYTSSNLDKLQRNIRESFFHHQSNYSKIKGDKKIDVLVLPQHVTASLSSQIKQRLAARKIHIISVVGVCHNVRSNDLTREYHQHKKEFPESKYLAVILGGDIQQPDGNEWLLYTKNSAIALADYIIANFRDMPIIITNGPRTGKIDPATKKVRADVHIKGNSDPVTAVFIQRLGGGSVN